MAMDDVIQKIADVENKKICPVCKKILHAGSVFTDHVKLHDEKPVKEKKVSDSNTKDYTCQYCGRVWVGWRAYAGHIIKCKLNPARQECIENIRKSHTGLRHSPETIEKIRKNTMAVLNKVERGKECIENIELFVHSERIDGKDRFVFYETFEEDLEI